MHREHGIQLVEVALMRTGNLVRIPGEILGRLVASSPPSSTANCSLCVIEAWEHLSPLQTEQEVILHYLKAEGVSVVSIKEPTLCREIVTEAS